MPVGLDPLLLLGLTSSSVIGAGWALGDGRILAVGILCALTASVARLITTVSGDLRTLEPSAPATER